MRFLAGECCVALLALSLFARTNQEAQDATISVDVRLVVLHPAVNNKRGEFASGLEKQNFQVFENGRLQTIRVFQHEDVPVAVGLVVDNSGSMHRKRSDVIAAALGFVRSSNPADEVFVVNFNDNVTFGLPDTELFSDRPSELESALRSVPAFGRTALYDAIEAGLGRLKQATLNKKVLIVISDGGDNASRHTLSQILHDAGLSDAMIYTIGLFDEDDTESNPRALSKIARATGGEAFFPEQPAAVVNICKSIAEDIRNQYTIAYNPTDPAGGYRTIKVVATRPGGGKLQVRTRAGYIVPPDAHSGEAKQ